MEIPSSSEDSDYVPNDEQDEERRRTIRKASSTRKRQKKGETTARSGGGGLASGSGSRNSDSDVPLANRRRKRVPQEEQLPIGGDGTADDNASDGSEVDVPLGLRQPALLRRGPGRSSGRGGPARQTTAASATGGRSKGKAQAHEASSRPRQGRGSSRAKKQSQQSRNPAGGEEEPGDSSTDYASLPLEVLRDIFLRACTENGAIPAVPKLRCVCRPWRAVVEACPEVWGRLDLSFGWCNPKDADVALHTQSGAWAQTEQVVLSGCGRLTDRSLQRLADSCLMLRTLNLSFCSCFSSQGISQALVQMPRLSSLNLSGIAVKPVRQTAADQIVKDVVTGPLSAQLEELVADFCPHLTNTAVRAITGSQSASLSALRVLSLTASGTTYGRISLPLEDLQRSCPNLERLQINGLGGMYGWQPGTAPQRPRGNHGDQPPEAAPSSAGFPRLVVAEVAGCQSVMVSGTQSGTSYVTDEALARLLHASHRLEELDISGTRAGAEGILSIPEGAPLRRVVVARGSAASDAALEALATRFSMTLEEMDASQGGRHITDHALCMMALCVRLSSLDVSGSAVMCEGVRGLMLCSASRGPRAGLMSLGLSSCRGVSRQIRAAAANGVPALLEELGLPSHHPAEAAA